MLYEGEKKTHLPCVLTWSGKNKIRYMSSHATFVLSGLIITSVSKIVKNELVELKEIGEQSS